MKWRSVKDELPRKRENILIFCELRGVRIWAYDPDDYINGFPTDLITHWMPLPDSPEVKEVVTSDMDKVYSVGEVVHFIESYAVDCMMNGDMVNAVIWVMDNLSNTENSLKK